MVAGVNRLTWNLREQTSCSHFIRQGSLSREFLHYSQIMFLNFKMIYQLGYAASNEKL